MNVILCKWTSSLADRLYTTDELTASPA
uniref:Uncharacterized protein n=1 Tax=Anguilla anguilla TaxID=7936 RepID=A0A0E9PZJ6_ANGAN